MAGIRDIAERRGELLHIDPRKLSIKDNWNSRDMKDPANIEHVNELCRSISEVGVKEPLKVVWEADTAYVTNGHCRLLAVQQAIKNGIDIKTVPVLAEAKFANEADRIFTQIVSNSGKPMTILEQSTVFKKLLDLGWSQKDISGKSGMTVSRVSQILELQTLPEPVKTMVRAGEVSASLAMQTVKSDPKAAETLSKAVEVAKDAGKTQAMPKHMGEPKARSVNGAKVVKDMIETAMADARFDESEGLMTISFKEEEWQQILNALKL